MNWFCIALALYLALSVALAFWLRFRWSFLQRLNDFHWQCWVMLDILVAFPIFWAAYLFHLVENRPTAGITISAFVGMLAADDIAWARVAASIINLPFRLLLSQSDHCAKEYAKWANPLGERGAAVV